MPFLQLEPGDVFVTRGTTAWSRLIRRLETDPGECRSIVNHCGIVVGYGDITEAPIVEAAIRAQRTTLSAEYSGKKSMVSIYRPLGLMPRTLMEISCDAMSMVGTPYGVLELPLHAMDWLLSRMSGRRRVVFRKLAKEDHTVICSGLLAQCFANHTDWRFCGQEPNVCQPDDVWDDWLDKLRGHPMRWRQLLALQRI